jgi:Ca2+ transporting ATPase
LKEYSPAEANVLRNGFFAKVGAADLVPGDIISVARGDRIPADCRLLSISSSSFRVDQAILTGESESVSKSTELVKVENPVKQDMYNMVFSVCSLSWFLAYSLPDFLKGHDRGRRKGNSDCRQYRIQNCNW